MAAEIAARISGVGAAGGFATALGGAKVAWDSATFFASGAGAASWSCPPSHFTRFAALLNTFMNPMVRTSPKKNNAHAKDCNEKGFKCIHFLPQSGMLVWRFSGLLTSLSASISSALIILNLVAAG